MNDDELKAAAERRAQAINARWQYPGNPYANSSLGDEEMRRDASRLADAMCDRLAADEAKPGDPLSELAWNDDARFVPDERGGHILWNEKKWRPE
jgi:hypothetical protein